MKTADLRYRNDGSEFGRVRQPRFRRVLDQREVRPGFVIIRQERLHMPVEGGLIENDDVIQTLAPQSANHSFHESSLPRRARSRKDFLDSRFHIPPKLTAEDVAAVPKQVPRDLLKGEGFPQLLPVHSAVGWAATLKCTIRLRSGARTMTTART